MEVSLLVKTTVDLLVFSIQAPEGAESVEVGKRASLLTDSYVSWPGEDFFSLPKSMHSMMLRNLNYILCTSQHSLEKAWKMKYLFMRQFEMCSGGERVVLVTFLRWFVH